jgi:hypothetical protein
MTAAIPAARWIGPRYRAKCEQKFEDGARPPIAFCSDPFGNGFCVVGTRLLV